MSDANRYIVEEQLSAYLDGELSDTERAEVERVLAADAEARAMLDSLRHTAELVQRLPRRHAPDTLIDDLSARIEREQLLRGAEVATPGARTRRSVWPMLATAAVVMFAAGAGFWVFRELTPARYGVGPVASRYDENKERMVRPESESGPRPAAAPTLQSADDRLRQMESDAERRDAALALAASVSADKKLGEKALEPAPAASLLADVSGVKNEAPSPADNLGLDAVASAKPETQDRAVIRQAGAAEAGWRGVGDDALVLNVSVSNQYDLVQCREQVTQFLAANRIAPAPVDEAVMQNLMRGVPRVGGQTPDRAGMVAQAEPMLVEMPASQLPALLDRLAPATAGQRGIELEIGQYVVASGADRVREVLGSRRNYDRREKDEARSAVDEWAAGQMVQSDNARTYGLAFTDAAGPATVPAEESNLGSRSSISAVAKSMPHSREADADVGVTETERNEAAPRPVVTEGIAGTSAEKRAESQPSEVRAKGDLFRGDADADESVVKLLINFLAPSDGPPAAVTSRSAVSPSATSHPAASQPKP